MTLKINDDLAALVAQEVKRSGHPFHVVVNRLLSLGLARARQPETAERFVVTPRSMGLPPGQSYDNVAELLDLVE